MLGVDARVRAVALLGKAPCQGDFIRHNAADPVSQHFHRWLEEGHEALHRANARLPAEPVSFVFTAPGGRQVLLGVMAPSSDKVGRAFPLAAYRVLDAAPAAEHLIALPEAHLPFLSAVRQLLADAATLPLETLVARLERLALVSPNPAAADAHRAQVLTAPATPLVRCLAGEGLPAGVPYYAFRTFLMACSAERGREPVKPGVMLDCPFPEETGPFPWLELARRVLQWRTTPPALFWLQGGQRRLLMSLGPPPASSLMYLARPESSSTKLWPLWTRQEKAIESARQALTPVQRQAIEQPGLLLQELLGAFST
jgi:type VI secretion system protein ImpM